MSVCLARARFQSGFGAASRGQRGRGASEPRGDFPETNPCHFLTRLGQTLYLPMDGKCCSLDGFKLYVTAIGSTLKKVLKKKKEKKKWLHCKRTIGLYWDKYS